MNKEEKIYMFNEYVLGYDEGNDDGSCLTISKVISGDMYVMGSLYDGSAKVISLILDNLQQENKQLKEKVDKSNELLNKILVVKENNIYRPVKNTTSQEVYKTIVLLNTILDTPGRMKYEELESGDSNE